MKFVRNLLFFLFLAVIIPLSVNAQEKFIFIEGTASRAAHLTFFMNNFKMEAASIGYTVVENKNNAKYTFKFKVEPFYDEDYPHIEYLILITLVSNADNSELLSFGWPFSDLDEMYEFNQYLFFKAIINIPAEEFEVREETVRVEVVREAAEIEDRDWQNKLLYIRGSLDYPVSLYLLKEDGLIGGIGVYKGTVSNPTNVAPLDNKFSAMPGITVGVEVQLLNWLCIEPILQLSFGDPLNSFSINASAGLEFKYPIKMFNSLMLEPYAAVLFPLITSDVFSGTPPLAAGLGIQTGLKRSEKDIIFINIGYIYFLGDFILKNPYGPLYPNPEGIHFQRSVITIGVGYKYGLFPRKN